MDENKVNTNNRNLLIAFFLILALIGIAIGIYFATREDTKDSFDSFWIATGADDNNNGNLMWSTDGKLWNESSSSGASFGPGALTRGGAGVAYGTGADGKNIWTAAGINSSGASAGNLMWSNDGKLWNESNSTGASFSTAGIGVAYGLSSDNKTGIWVAAGDNTGGTSAGNLLWSTNGKLWNESTGTSFTLIGRTAAYGLSSDGTGLWVAGGDVDSDNFSALKWSVDGKEWNDSSSSGTSFIGQTASDIAYGLSSDNKTGIWVAAGDNFGGTSFGKLKWSLDGQVWNNSTSTGASFDTFAFGVRYGLTDDKSTGIWVAAGEDNDGGKFLWSLDGQTWNESTGTTHGVSSNNVAYGLGSDGVTGIWVGAGFGDNNYQHMVWSSDGKHWLPSSDKGASFTVYGFDTASNLTNVAFKGTTQSSYLPKIPDVFPNFNPY